MSQMDVELAIDASFGSISRIEAGRVNPTKETIVKISKFLKLNDKELYYIIGPNAIPADNVEISHAREEVREYFSKKGVLAYLLDDRARLIDFSRSFEKFFRISDEEIIENLREKTLPEILLNDDLYINRFFKGPYYENNIRLLLDVFYTDMGFMVNDQYYLKALSFIEGNPVSKKIWESIISETPNHKLFNFENRKIFFNILGHKVELLYAREVLPRYRRFYIVEYTPKNDVVALLTKLL